jgi:hypothetical protein
MMNDEHIREFLADSLALWRVSAMVEAGEAPIVAVIRTSDGATIRVERYAVHSSTSSGRTDNLRAPFRWVVHAERPRPCASIAGVLNALRGALGVERGEPIRVVAAVRPEPVEGRTTT